MRKTPKSQPFGIVWICHICLTKPCVYSPLVYLIHLVFISSALIWFFPCYFHFRSNMYLCACTHTDARRDFSIWLSCGVRHWRARETCNNMCNSEKQFIYSKRPLRVLSIDFLFLFSFQKPPYSDFRLLQLKTSVSVRFSFFVHTLGKLKMCWRFLTSGGNG